MQKDYRMYFEDILGSIGRIESYTKGLGYADFEKNNLVSDAVLRNLEIIGEAVKNVPGEIKKKYPEVEWKKMAGLRDILIHAYSGIDLEIVWDVVKNKLPGLKNSLERIMKGA